MEDAAEVEEVGVDPPDDGPFDRDPPEIALSLEALSTPCEDRLVYEALEGTPPEATTQTITHKEPKYHDIFTFASQETPKLMFTNCPGQQQFSILNSSHVNYTLECRFSTSGSIY